MLGEGRPLAMGRNWEAALERLEQEWEGSNRDEFFERTKERTRWRRGNSSLRWGAEPRKTFFKHLFWV